MRIYSEIQSFRKDFDPALGRELPFMLRLSVIIGNPISIIGLAFLIISIPFVLVFVANSDFKSLKFDEYPPTTEGSLTKVEPTNSSVNDQLVYKYTYDYRLPNGASGTGVSYTEGMVLQEGEKIEIEYVKSDPKISRIKGMKTSMFDLWVLVIILPFLLVGGGLFGWSLYKGLNAIKLLRFGLIGYGKFISKSPTNVMINKRTVYEFVFEFTGKDNNKYLTTVRTHQPENLLDDAEEKLVYDISNPTNAVLIDSLPKAVKVFFYNLQ